MPEDSITISSLLSSLKPWIPWIITGASVLANFYQTRINRELQLMKMSREPTMHKCRIFDDNVYTYWDKNNQPSPPICVWLATDGSRKCRFDPKDDKEKKQMQDTNGGKCYFTLWSEK